MDESKFTQYFGNHKKVYESFASVDTCPILILEYGCDDYCETGECSGVENCEKKIKQWLRMRD